MYLSTNLLVIYLFSIQYLLNYYVHMNLNNYLYLLLCMLLINYLPTNSLHIKASTPQIYHLPKYFQTKLPANKNSCMIGAQLLTFLYLHIIIEVHAKKSSYMVTIKLSTEKTVHTRKKCCLYPHKCYAVEHSPYKCYAVEHSPLDNLVSVDRVNRTQLN